MHKSPTCYFLFRNYCYLNVNFISHFSTIMYFYNSLGDMIMLVIYAFLSQFEPVVNRTTYPAYRLLFFCQATYQVHDRIVSFYLSLKLAVTIELMHSKSKGIFKALNQTDNPLSLCLLSIYICAFYSVAQYTFPLKYSVLGLARSTPCISIRSRTPPVAT